MAADGNTAPISANSPTEAPASGGQPSIMPVIVQDTTGAISRDGLTTINKPDTGTIRVIDTGNLPELNFSFAASDVKLTALDVDLVMIFKDNSKIILPSLAMDLIGNNPPRLTFKGSVASPQSVVAQIGQTNLVEITPSVQLSSPDFLPKKKGGNTNDSFTGDSNANYLGGGVGDDTLIGGGGADTLAGGTGNDSLRLDWSSLNLSNLDGGAGTDTVVLTGTGSVSLNFTASAFTGVLTNTEYLDFSAATSSNNLSVNLDGAGIQKILTGSTSNTNAGVLDLKLDTGHFDTLTLAANGTYSYWTAASAGTQISNGASITTINLSTLNATGQDIYVFDSTHTTLLADLHYHV